MSTPAANDAPQFDVHVSSDDAGQRIDAFLAGQLTTHSRTIIRKAITSGDVLVNNARVKAAYRLDAGDHITGRLPAKVAEGPIPEDIPLDILYEDEDLVAVNKPPRMVVHPAKGHWSGTLTSALAFHIDQLSAIGGAVRPGIVHRLDRDTSGVILVAKHDVAHMALASQFEQRTIKKYYLAVCRGRVDRDQDIVDQPIGIHPYQREKMAIRANHSTSREAKTIFEVQQRFVGFTLVCAKPQTGRTHQIRVHLAHVGHPVVCDRLYAGHGRITEGEILRTTSTDILLDRQALHAWKIEFEHPCNGQRMTIEAPLAEDIARLVAALHTHRSRT